MSPARAFTVLFLWAALLGAAVNDLQVILIGISGLVVMFGGGMILDSRASKRAKREGES